MATATHVTIGPTDAIVVLHDGRVRITGEDWSVTVEPSSAAQAHRLATAFEESRELLAEERERRLASVGGLTA